MAGIVSVYTHNSHADVLLSRMLQTETLDGRGRLPALRLASLYVDQRPAADISARLAKERSIPVFGTIREALTLGGSTLDVDGVLLIAEHGRYPESPLGQELYPRKRFFDETEALFREANRAVPVFLDKHLSHDWKEAKAIYETARRMRIPLMAGSSLPVTWRRPPREIPRESRIREIVAVSYHTLYGYGFHALEMVQCLAERRRGGESGVRRVQCLSGSRVWEAMRLGRFDADLLEAALGRLSRPLTLRQAEAAPDPTLFLLEHLDGFRAAVLTLNPIVGEWAAGWKGDGSARDSTLFWTQEERPLGHFTFLLRGIESLIRTGRPAWPVERTLLTSGALEALLISRHRGGTPFETSHLRIPYRTTFDWTDPGPPPPGRPLEGP